MARKTRPADEAPPVQVRPVIDPLDMTLRDLLTALVDARAKPVNDVDEWIDIRGDRYPWRHIVESAEQGECEVSRVGRRLMMRRQELSRWLSSRRIGSSATQEKERPDDKSLSEEEELRRQARASLRRAGYRA